MTMILLFSYFKLVELHTFTRCLMYFYLQEIYPPKLSEFAYVTDGACTENEILGEELLMLKVTNPPGCPFHWIKCLDCIFFLLYFALSTHKFFFIFPQGLNWSLSPITVNSWLNIYLQLSCLGSKCGKTSNFNIPNYSQQQFVQVTQVCIKYSCCCSCTYICSAAYWQPLTLIACLSWCTTQSGISHSIWSSAI